MRRPSPPRPEVWEDPEDCEPQGQPARPDALESQAAWEDASDWEDFEAWDGRAATDAGTHGSASDGTELTDRGATQSSAAGVAAWRGLRGDVSAFGRRASRALSPETQPGPREFASNAGAIISTGLTDRLAERRRAIRKIHMGRLWRGAVAVLAALAVIWLLLFSPLLALRSQNITLTGADSTVTVEEVRTALEPMTGTSLLRLHLDAAGQTVSDSLVRVRSASATRSWPNGLVVQVEMRVPVAYRESDTAGSVDILDGEAVVLETTEAIPAGLAHITGDSLTPEGVSAVAAAIGALDVATRERVASGSVSESGLVTLRLDNGAVVHWGDSSLGALKASVLAVLLQQQAAQYDVSSPNDPTTSLSAAS